MLVYLVAGEASGDILGGRLMAALRRRRPDIQFAGVGGDRMAEQGLHTQFPMRELSLMGLMEVLPSIRRLARRLDETAADIAARRPAVVVTIDAPGFTLRLADRVKPLGIPVVHYVAPQLWAWRPGRAKKLRHRVDQILGLLPFEPEFFARYGMKVRFVGHPILESGANTGDAARFRATHGIRPDERVVIVMPGSRRGEVSRLLAVFGEALQLVAAQVPGLRPVVPLAGPVEATVRAGTASWPVPPILVREQADKFDAYAAAEAGLIKSGTSSVEMALAGVPHLIAYRLNLISGWIAALVLRVPFVSLVNLLADRAVVPEYLLWNCTAPNLAAALLRLLNDEETRASQRAGFAEVLASLRPPEGLPSEAAAAAVLEAVAE